MNEKKLKKELTDILGVEPEGSLKDYEYNTWLSFLRNVPTTKLMAAKDWLQENLPIEAYAAAARWIEIIGNPHRIDKLLQSKLDKDEEEDLMNLAIGDDQEAFYVALVKKTARELNESATSQEVARLSMNLKIFQSELAAIRSKKAKKGSLIEKIMTASALPVQAPRNAIKPLKKAKKKTTTKRKITKKGKKNANNNHSKSARTPASNAGVGTQGTRNTSSALGNSSNDQHSEPIPKQNGSQDKNTNGDTDKKMA